MKKRPPRTPSPSGSEIQSDLGLPGGDFGRLADAEADSAFRWAAAAVGGSDVLVVGCGPGHGTKVLVEAGAASVTAVDADARSIEIAGRLYGDSVAFKVAEPFALPFAPQSFEVVVCIDSADTAIDPDAGLAELSRVLAGDGLLLVSMPLPGSPREPSDGDTSIAADLTADLETRFANVVRFRRRLAVAAVVGPDSEEVTDLTRASWVGAGRSEDRTVLLAASDSELPELPSLATMVGLRDLRTQQETLAAWEERARRAEADGSAKHWELVAAREAQRRFRMRLHHIEHRPLRRLGRILRGKPSRISAGPKMRESERKKQRWD